MRCQLLSVNRTERLELSVLCPWIFLHLASYLDSPSAPSMPNYPFANLKTILVTSDSSNILDFETLQYVKFVLEVPAHWAYSHSRVISEFQRSPCPNLAHAKPDLSFKPKTIRYGSLPQLCLISFCNESDFISLQALIIWWKYHLTPVMNLGEVQRAQLAKSTLLTSTLVPLGSFQIF